MKKQTFEWPDLVRELTLRETLAQARPRQQVEILLSRSEQLGIYLSKAPEALGLVDLLELEGGQHYAAEFNLLIEKLIGEIESEQVRPIIQKGQAFVDGPKSKREDALAKQMRKTWETFLEESQQNPTARELWDALPSGNTTIQEKDGEILTIFWRNSSGSEKSTEFKAFQNRYTDLKKKHFS